MLKRLSMIVLIFLLPLQSDSKWYDKEVSDTAFVVFPGTYATKLFDFEILFEFLHCQRPWALNLGQLVCQSI